jgi:GTP-binding protein EngB required for normal cell division
MVQDLIVLYMKQRRSIILAVISTDNAFANQPVTKFARQIDPSGTRKLGLITKPDKIDQGSDSEKYYNRYPVRRDALSYQHLNRSLEACSRIIT